MARRKNYLVEERIAVACEHAQVTDDTTLLVYKVPTGRKFRLDRAIYVNPTGLAEDGSNFFEVAVMNGATKMASHSTDSGEDGDLPANEFVDLGMSSTDADLVADGDDVLSLVLDETGTATLPAGRLVLEGRLL